MSDPDETVWHPDQQFARLMSNPDVTVAYFTQRGAERGRDYAWTRERVPRLMRIRRVGGLLKWRLEVWL